MPRKDLLRRIALQMRDGQQQVLGRDVLVLEIVGFLESALQQLGWPRWRAWPGRLRRRRPSGKLLDLAIDLVQHGLRADADLFQHRRNNAFLVLEQRRQQVQRQQLRIAVLGGELVPALDGFLRFYCEFVPTDCHGDSLAKSFVIILSQAMRQLAICIVGVAIGPSFAKMTNF